VLRVEGFFNNRKNILGMNRDIALFQNRGHGGSAFGVMVNCLRAILIVLGGVSQAAIPPSKGSVDTTVNDERAAAPAFASCFKFLYDATDMLISPVFIQANAPRLMRHCATDNIGEALSPLRRITS
jgi:hypothetical protein